MNNHENEFNALKIRIRKTISITKYDQDLIEEIKNKDYNWAKPGEIKDSTIIQRAIRCYHSTIFPPENQVLPFN